MNAARFGAHLCAILLTVGFCTSIVAQPRTVAQRQAGSSLQWSADFAHAAATLRVAGPDSVVEKSFGAETVEFLADPSKLKEGSYLFELTFISSVAPPGLSRDTPRTPPQVARMNGSFLVQGGVLYSSTSTPALKENQRPDGKRARASDLKDQVVADDQIVQGSLCVGLDCVNNESFGFDTIRLKENNTRIKFEDTSTGSFPSTDWQLTANDSPSGGANRFSIEDVTAATNPFTISGGAPNNSVFVSSTGKLGLRTATPVLDIHSTTGNTPALRFEQDGTGGFSPQTWDVAGNEANFFVRDVTGGSRLPFRIRPGAPTSSIDIATSGNVGIGIASPALKVHAAAGDTPGLRLDQTAAASLPVQVWDIAGNDSNFFIRDVTGGALLPLRIRPGAPTSSIDVAANGNVGFGVAAPAQPLHVRRTDGSTRMLIEEASASTASRTLASFVNNGDVTVSYQSTAAPLTTWETTAGQSGFRVRVAGAATSQMTLAANGNLNITGALTQASSVTLKENVVPVSGEQLLQAIKKLPIYTWNYLSSSKDEKHLGPTAEDFHRSFALGNNPKAIAPGDMAGVALGAIQALSAALSEKDRELAALRERMSALEALVMGARSVRP
jgi:Chaperone of endosialidase